MVSFRIPQRALHRLQCRLQRDRAGAGRRCDVGTCNHGRSGRRCFLPSRSGRASPTPVAFVGTLLDLRVLDRSLPASSSVRSRLGVPCAPVVMGTGLVLPTRPVSCSNRSQGSLVLADRWLLEMHACMTILMVWSADQSFVATRARPVGAAVHRSSPTRLLLSWLHSWLPRHFVVGPQ